MKLFPLFVPLCTPLKQVISCEGGTSRENKDGSKDSRDNKRDRNKMEKGHTPLLPSIPKDEF